MTTRLSANKSPSSPSNIPSKAATVAGSSSAPPTNPDQNTKPGWVADPKSKKNLGKNEIAFAAAASSSTSRATRLPPPNQRGPYEVEEKVETLKRGNRDIPVVAELPKDLNNAPAVLFLPGFKLDSKLYDDTTKFLASHGFAVVRVDPDDDVFQWDHTEMSLDAVEALEWMTSEALEGRVNKDSIGIAGHSLGGKLAAMVTASDRRIKAFFAIDPVNQRKPDVFANGEIGNITVPLGIIGQTVDQEGGLLKPAATPKGWNFQAFYERATNARDVFAVTIPNADHFDFVDEDTFLEALASKKGTAERTDVLALTQTLLTAFFRKHLTGETIEPTTFVPSQLVQQR